jgi:hypothetical protein
MYHNDIYLIDVIECFFCILMVCLSHIYKMAKKTPNIISDIECFLIRQRPTLPGGLPPSTIGAERLNFCVRYGNRCDPFAIVTGYCPAVLDSRYKLMGVLHPQNYTMQSLIVIDQALDRLVSVSFIHYCTSTSDLSTS